MKQKKDMLSVTLKSGETIQVERLSYAVEEWCSGKWQVIQCFPGTKEGYEKAFTLMNKTDNDYVRIQQYH